MTICKLMKLNLNYISSVLFRVLPGISYDFSSLHYLYSDKNIRSYFKRVRQLQEYPGLYDYFKSRGFDMTLCDKVREQSKDMDSMFLENVKNNHTYTTDKKNNLFMCGIKQVELDYVVHIVHTQIFPTGINDQVRNATKEEVLSHVNGKASQGLPNPFIKKRDILDEISEIMDKFYKRTLRASEIFRYPSAAFMRAQVKDKGLTTRVVNAVQAFQQSVESFFYISFCKRLHSSTCIDIGRTQPEISDIVKTYKDYNVYCFDHSKWDFIRQQVLGIISFIIIEQALNLSRFERSFLMKCRNYYLTLPMFHPTVKLLVRRVGTVSGSSFTSLENSLSNIVLLSISYFRYCQAKGISPYDNVPKLHVLGDDSLFGTKLKEFDHESFIKIANSSFGCNLKLEIDPVPSGICEAYYLGSHWIKGKPFRKERVLVCSVVFGSGNFPYMTTNELLVSRFIEVFGNSADCAYYFKRLRLKSVPRRIFFFKELSNPWVQQRPFTERKQFSNTNLSTLSFDSRGIWYNPDIVYSSLSILWKDR